MGMHLMKRLLDIIFLNNNPAWIIDYLIEVTVFLQINKEWREKFLTCDNYCDKLMRRSWWFKRGILLQYKLDYSCQHRKFKSAHLLSAFHLCQFLYRNMAKKVYLIVRSHEYDMIGYVFCKELPGVITNRWSCFSYGRAQVPTLFITVRLIKEHGFIEVMSDDPDCKCFIRTIASTEHFIIENMFGKHLPYYWFRESLDNHHSLSSTELAKYITQ